MRRLTGWLFATTLIVSAICITVFAQTNSSQGSGSKLGVTYSQGKVCSIVAVGKKSEMKEEKGEPPKSGRLWRDTFPVPDSWTPTNCANEVGDIAGSGEWYIGCFAGGKINLGKTNDGTPIPPCWP